MPTVRDLEITGRHPAADGIHIEGVMQPTLTGVLIREVRHAMRITGRARNVIVDHCHIYHNTGVGILLDAVNLHQTIISDSHISYCALGGIRIQDSEIRNLQITGNDIEYNNARSHPGMAADAPTAEIYVDVREGSVREGTICSNTIQATYSPGGANIRFVGRGGGQDQKAGMWTITGNLIGSQENNIHLSSARGITMTGNHLYSAHRRNILIEDSRNIVISGNCFGHNPDYGDSQLCTGLEIVRSQDCVLSGLLIEDCATGENTVAGAPAVDRAGLIQLTACKRLTLSGLHLTNPSPVGFSIHDCSETVLSGCSVHETRQPAADTRSVHWIGQGNGNLIAACRLSTPTEIDESANVRTAANSVS